VADTVIVVGVRRNRERVSASEIRQMIGRAGRRHDGGTSRAIVVVEEEDEADVRQEVSDVESIKVVSAMTDTDIVAFHLLPEVCSGTFVDTKDAEEWYSRGFRAFQGGKVDVTKAFNRLIELEAIQGDSGYSPTQLGKIASRLYFHPGDIKAWRDNFSQVFDMGLECDDVAIAWALGNVPVTRMGGDFGNHWEAVELCRAALPLGIEVTKGCITTITLWRYVLGGPPVGKMRNAALTLRADAARICRALAEIDKKDTGWGMDDFFEELAWRLKRGIPENILTLCRLEGITKSRALWLYNGGVRGRQDIPNFIQNMDEDEVDEAFMKVLRDLANGVR
jgi:replicative superfamily II helicase